MIKNIMLKVIEEKYNELEKYNKKNDLFWQLEEFEGNAVGQIGEEFIKRIFKNTNIPFNSTKKIIRDEYDMISSGKKIEIKTARKGRKNNTFQFNGINPRYNYNYLIFVGITKNEVLYKIINKDKIKYVHKERKHFVNLKNNKKQLVKMNPNNEVNFKLTLNIKDMINAEDNLENELANIFK